MTEYRQERDRELAMAFASSARILRQFFREWIQGELNDLAVLADGLEPALEGLIRSEMQGTVRRIRDINQDELGECVRSLQGRIDEIDNGLYDNALDAQQYLSEGLIRLESLVRELLRVRDSLDDLWESHTELRS